MPKRTTKRKPERSDKRIAAKPRLQHINFFGDTQIGGTTSLFPGRIDLAERSYYGNARQTFIYGLWNEYHDDFVPERIGRNYALNIHGGDIIEGVHHGTTEIMTNNIEHQVELACEILRPVFKRAERNMIVRGTAAHAGSESCFEEAVGRRLGTYVKGVQPDTLACSAYWYRLQTHSGWKIFVSHHIGTARRSWTSLSALQSEMAEALIQSARFGFDPPDLMIFFHRHTCAGGWFATDRKVMQIATAPSWQYLTSYGARIAAGHASQIGGLVMVDHGRHKAPELMPFVRAIVDNEYEPIRPLCEELKNG